MKTLTNAALPVALSRLVRILRWNLWWRRPLHSFYRRYLRESCGGAHHVGAYGPDGRYIVLMNEDQYHRYTMLARDVDSSDANDTLCREAGQKDAR